MGKVPVEFTSWIGGQSPDAKYGPEASFAYSRGIDFRKSSSSISLLPRTTKDTGSLVTSLPMGMIEVGGRTFYSPDENGNVYRKSAGTWSKLSDSIVTYQGGMGFNLAMDRVFLTSDETISSIKNATGRFGGSPTIEPSLLGPSIDQVGTGTGQTFNVSSSLSETTANMIPFRPATEPFFSFKAFIVQKTGGGTVTYTATLHDKANNVLGTSTVSLGSAAVNNTWIEFIFTGRPRLSVQPSGAEYHIHITQLGSIPATTFRCGTLNDSTTATYETWSARLVGNNVEHPMIEFLNFLLIGNERYVSVWEPITTAPTDLEFLRHRLVFPSGRQVIGFALWGDYVGIATGSWSNSDGGIANGKIYFWNGTSKSYDMILDVPEGAPTSLFAQLNRLYWVANGSLYTWAGGEIEKVWQFPNTDTEYKGLIGQTYMNSEMMAVRNGILMIGYPQNTPDPAVEHGIYSHGRRDVRHPLSTGLSYSISTGKRFNTIANTVQMEIGFVKTFGTELYIGWADYSAGQCGIDRVGSNSLPNAAGIWESLIIDDKRPRKQKEANELYLTCEPLPAGGTVGLRYRIDRGAWQVGDTVSTTGVTEIRLNINKRYKEIQVGLTIGADTISPVITSAELIRDRLDSEQD